MSDQIQDVPLPPDEFDDEEDATLETGNAGANEDLAATLVKFSEMDFPSDDEEDEDYVPGDDSDDDDDLDDEGDSEDEDGDNE